jgi:hypothetical protein
VGPDSRPSRERVDQVHAWLVYRREVTRAPFRALAAEIGLPKSTVQKFHAQKTYPQKIWPSSSCRPCRRLTSNRL